MSEILAGFAGGSFSGLPFCQNEQAELSGTNSSSRLTIYDTAHITMTYAALVSLLILGDDLSRVAKEPIVRALKKLQQPNGCYIPCITDFEPDLRFLFCAAAISYILDDWSGMDREAAIRFIHECQTYEHAFSQSPRQEAHGGTTYCAVATLGLMGENACADQKTMTRDDDAGEDDNAFQKRKQAAGYFDKEGTKRWCLNRQTTGFQGRVNKPTDTCYSFWIGGALEIIGGMDLVNHECNRGFLLETQSKIIGGFSKWVDSSPEHRVQEGNLIEEKSRGGSDHHFLDII
ncbi:Geranylgeranyl transferase type-1 subunit beta [Lunasporangiospora selenospora]|uniref:Geranylgeranyl transferase type-1 subunit beta n=1 Tax=Lunasporangiospora selenospora TaxID=979761 RepID=A0A9P6KI00_9FUNG|nr:Geranylgeranyl transferase type-1 subunit beta [Lunasporangiospora selenospora]